MPKITGTNVDITGTQASELATQLKWFSDNNLTAKDLITKASGNALKIEVKDAGHCHAVSQTQVELGWGECHQDLKELSETALFEIKNAVNYSSYGAADKKLNYNMWTILEYGYEMAIRECPSSIALFNILTALAGRYTPSSFGQGHITKNQLAATTSTTIEKIFADSKHVASATTGSDSLKSKHLYSYDALERVGQNFSSAGAKIKKITTSIKTNSGAVVDTNSEDFRTKILADFSTSYTPTKKDYAQLKKALVSYILALDKLATTTPTWQISWSGSGSDWVSFAREVIRADSIVVGTIPDDMAATFRSVFA